VAPGGKSCGRGRFEIVVVVGVVAVDDDGSSTSFETALATAASTAAATALERASAIFLTQKTTTVPRFFVFEMEMWREGGKNVDVGRKKGRKRKGEK